MWEEDETEVLARGMLGVELCTDIYKGALWSAVGEYCCCWGDDDDEVEFDINRLEVIRDEEWPSEGQNISSLNEFGRCSERDESEQSSSSIRKTLLLDGRWEEEIIGEGENEAVRSLDDEDRGAIGVEKPPDELSINAA
jgi:hypothetical protein